MGTPAQNNIQNNSLQSGAVIAEAAISIVLAATIIFGLGQILWAILTKIEHQSAWMQIQLGPQDPAMEFQPGSVSGMTSTPPSFLPLSTTITTSPSLGSFMNKIFQGYRSEIANSEASLFLNLSYLRIKNTSGEFDSNPILSIGSVADPANPPGWCNDKADVLISRLNNYVQENLNRMSSYTTVYSGAAIVGIKLIDVNFSGTNYKRFLPLFPVLFGLQCSDPPAGVIFAEGISTSMTAPRILVGVSPP